MGKFRYAVRVLNLVFVHHLINREQGGTFSGKIKLTVQPEDLNFPDKFMPYKRTFYFCNFFPLSILYYTNMVCQKTFTL